MSTVAIETIRIPCPFCDRVHTGEYWDEVDEQVMDCRDRVSPKKRGDLLAFKPGEFDRNTITTESQIPH